MILEAEAGLVPMGPRSPLRFGRCRADVPRTSCGLRSAPVGAKQTSPGCLAPHLPRDYGYRWAGAPWFKVSPPARSARGMRSPGPHSVSAPLRSLQNRRPPDVLQPIFRKASIVVGQALHGSKVSASRAIFRVKMG